MKYPFTYVLYIIVAILSLMPVPETPLSSINLIDKWTHLLMYFGLTSAFWLDYCRLNGLQLFQKRARFFSPRLLQVEKMSRAMCLKYALALPVAYGGLMELLQEYCTNHLRSGDWIDWLADALGSLIGYGFCALLVRCFFPKK